MKASGDEGSARPSAEAEQAEQASFPLVRLKRPLTHEDIPQLYSTVNLLQGVFSGKFTDRQQQCLAKDSVVGPVYEAVMVRKESIQAAFQVWCVQQ